ncbi:MAG TPA: hypothetical protein VFM79_04235 [Pelobium sp.]|nr:hypothetical protein [Pelobium sp.]
MIKRTLHFSNLAYLSLQKDQFLSPFTYFHCNSRENADVHIKRVKNILPAKGHIGIMTVTDWQFGMMGLFHGKAEKPLPGTSQQLELF